MPRLGQEDAAACTSRQEQTTKQHIIHYTNLNFFSIVLSQSILKNMQKYATRCRACRYAQRQGLPEGYVPVFVSAVAAKDAESVSRGGGAGSVAPPQPGRVG